MTKNKLPKFIGPVESLESYVQAEWWKHIFNANYLKTDGDVVNDQAVTDHEIDYFVEVARLQPDDFILDLCCGQGRHSITLAQRGFKHVHGLDRSHYLIRRARTEVKQKGLDVQFKEGDARRLPYPADTFDFVMIPGNSFGYFESRLDDAQVLSEIYRVLQPGGRLLLDITDGDYIRNNFEKRSWEWIDKKSFVCRERSLSSDDDRLISREVITHVTKGVVADQFYAERLYTRDDIARLLAQGNFEQVIFHDVLEVESQRNQDLGMMARRFVVTSSIQKDWSRTEAASDMTSVYVLLGDPRIPDQIKPNNAFDEDDMFTINELKRSLASLDGFRFTYIDNHADLITTLKEHKENIDLALNLCDEGFNNEATKELHVPALLEMLKIPYSGGNPQCLAYCYDKSLVRGIANEMDLPVPKAYIVKPEDTTFIDFPLDFPVIVKPNFGDSSIGINQHSVCNNTIELEQAILSVRQRLGFDSTILIEEYLTGKDISIGIIGNLPSDYTILPIIEEDYSALPEGLPRICGYEAKWDPESPYWKITSRPADLPIETSRFLEASCSKLFGRLNLRDYGRFDWRLDKQGTPRLLEVNPNPGWCWDGHLAKMCKIADISYPKMLERIIKSASYRNANAFIIPSLMH